MKYELKWDSVVVKYSDRYMIKAGVTVDLGLDSAPELLASFDTEDTALEELTKYKTKFCKTQNGYLVEEYWVEMNEYDEDGERTSCWSDFIGFSEMVIEVYDRKLNNVVATYDNFEAAEKALERYVENDCKDVIISFAD